MFVGFFVVVLGLFWKWVGVMGIVWLVGVYWLKCWLVVRREGGVEVLGLVWVI